MRADREDDLCEGFSTAFIFHVRRVVFERVLFYYAEWQEAYQLQYETCKRIRRTGDAAILKRRRKI